MNISSLLKSHREDIILSLAIEGLKEKLNEDIETFHFRWESETRFIISLKFSFGSSLTFDTHYHNTKSDIIAKGNLTELSNLKTKISLETKSRYWLLFLLFLPILMLIIDLWLQIGIFIPAYFIFPILFLILTNAMRNEDKRLIRNFKTYLHQN